MIKKDSNFRCTKERKEAFEKIKESIVEAPTLRSPNFDKEFILYTFASNHLIMAVLTQKNEVKEEFLVSFMSIGLQRAKLNYPAIDKQDFAVFKVVKHFQPYLLRSHTKIIVPHSMVRSLLIQKEPRDRRGKWLASLQEDDLEIRPAKLAKGQGLCKLAAEALDLQEEEEGWEKEADMLEMELLYIPASTNSWYNDLKYYLTHGSFPSHLDARKRQALRLMFAQYQMIDGILFWKNYDNVLLR